MKIIQILVASFALVVSAAAQTPTAVPLTPVETAFLVAANNRLQSLQTASTTVSTKLAQVTTQEQTAVKALESAPTTQLAQLAQQVQQLVQQMNQLTRQNTAIQGALVQATKELTSDKAQVLKGHNLSDSSTFSADFTTATGVPAQA
jgi:uncharacterized phage infection (PIP) family protein YhgE